MKLWTFISNRMHNKGGNKRMRNLMSKARWITSLVVILVTIMGLLATTVFASTAYLVGTASGGPVTHGNLPGGSKWAGTLEVTLDGGSERYEVYCADLGTDWCPAPLPNDHAQEQNLDPLDAHVVWILNNYYPHVPTEPDGLIPDKKAAAVQLAIWHFTDSLDISSGGSPTDVFDAARAIIAAAGTASVPETPTILTLEPSSGSNPVGFLHTVTATLKDQNGDLLAGKTVSFTVTGANAASGSAVTNSSGQATFTYTGSTAGNDTITATVTYTVPIGLRWLRSDCQDLIMAEEAPGQVSATATKQWYQLGSIGDYVWNDADWEGDQDEVDAGIANITVALRDANGDLVALTETDSNGYYLFDNLVAGTYTVDVDENDRDMPAGYWLTSEAIYGPDPMTVTLHPGEDYRDADFGYAEETSPLGGIGDYVWHDKNGDTVQDANEEGIGDITLTLYEWTGSAWSYLDEMSTDYFGNYWFGGHEVGDYKVVVDDNDPDMPAGFHRTTELGSICVHLDTSSYQVDCGGFGGSARSAIQAVAGIRLLQANGVEDYPYADFGYRGPYIGDYVWNDEDGDGKQGSAFDVGINGVELELWLDNDLDGNVSAGDTSITTTITANNPVDDKPGFYLFDGLSAGTYIVRIAPAEFDSGGTLYEYTATLPNQGTDDTVDSDGDNPDCPYPCGAGDSVWEDNILATVTLTDTDNITIDFGVQYTGPPTVITLSSFAAKSSAGGSSNWLWLGLVSLPVLAAGSSRWIRRQSRQGKIV
jgi:TQXA domain-containing protein